MQQSHPLPNNKVLELPKSKAFKGNKFSLTGYVSERIENIAEKGGGVGYQHVFFRFPISFTSWSLKSRNCLLKSVLYQTLLYIYKIGLFGGKGNIAKEEHVQN